ncbi:hypothetical protein SPRG_04778 [Saprolegnia parasitica CBS 223.65]|uniref:CHK kinase-like domain-containing protein n=1 Tax=Saprolegnia parasitica (strain CBS 223.65) TaxID=695850 RepID=A0A067CWH2_SAPPC|nr:hypothetical protein SPRG_04778 [Saprolegnia parasitica CBS 223.65]KDO30876.1 hypothetical protein SPRG_04778 [Saprolegnia parasitica CBS 223.65]|eukprot:XP_012198571.1 hypothetical protein SPRG_04778 [Saprolegnia parasitica CBS 223.65]
MARKAAKQSDAISEAIAASFPGATVQSKRELCSLWAGYGSIYQVFLSNGNAVIVKSITPPRSNSVSNQRKLRSYEVEGYFYAQLAPKSLARVPMVHAIERYDGPSFCFVLEDLSAPFPDNTYSLQGVYLDAALDWLANFHASYWNHANDDDGVGRDGGYWYLATRQEELASMGTDSLATKLKAQAAAIDAKTRDPQYETLLHGDAKSANMLWKKATDGSITCAWVDFQYVGQGLGARDLAYLLCSSTSRSALRDLDALLQRYLDTFLSAMATLGKDPHGYNLAKLKEHFHWCLLDYVRFMAGWGFWGNYDWAIAETKHLLA